MKRSFLFCLLFIPTIFSLSFCDYSKAQNNEGEKMALKDLNVTNEKMRVVSTIPFQYVEGSGATLDFTAGDYDFEVVPSEVIKITDSPSVLVSFHRDEFEKKNSELAEVDKSKGQAFNTKLETVSVGIAYFELFEPVFVVMQSSDANKFDLWLYVGNGVMDDLLYVTNTSGRIGTILPKGKYYCRKFIAGSGYLQFFSISGKDVTTTYNYTTTSPGW